MSKIKFITLEEVYLIHHDQILHYGGSNKIRDKDLLESAVGIAQAEFQGTPLHKNIFEMAAAYLFHITKNHPFIDANKRTGAAVADIFLSLNGYELEAPSDEFEKLVFGTAEGRLQKSEIADFFERHSSKKKE